MKLFLILTIFLSSLLHCKDIYVSTTGSDSNSGQINDEVQTLEKAVELLETGDSIFIKEGRYPVDNLFIDSVDSFTITNFEDDEVILDGTQEITTDWEQYDDNVWMTTAPFKFWQLFIDEEMVGLARYPSVDLWSEDFWNRFTLREQDSELSSEGHMVDVAKDCEPETQTLAGQSNSFDKCIAILNTGHWWTVTSPVSNHVQGTAEFDYTNDVDFWFDDGHYFIECLTALDAPNEWGYDWENDIVYAWPADGINPNDVVVRGKTSNFLLNIMNSQHFTISNLQIFGGGVRLNENTHVTIDNVHFNYASYHMRVLNEKHRAPGALVISRNGASKDIPSENTIRNCRFEFTDGVALEMVRGKDDTIENNIFSNIDYSAAYAQGAVDFLTSTGTTFRYNTVDTTGSSETVRAGASSTLEYNLFRNGGSLQEDGAAIQIPTAGQTDSIIYRNWAVDTDKIGFRFDTPSGNDKMGYGGTMQENVAFNARRGFSVKGDDHVVVGNTALLNTWGGAAKNDMTVYIDNLGNADIPYNFNTETDHNLVDKLSGATNGFTEIRNPGDNWNGYEQSDTYLWNLLRDPAHGDFRPVDQSVDEYGAYAAGELDYWIPGYKAEYAASYPLPADESTEVPVDVALKWQTPVADTTFTVYFGTDSTNLVQVATDYEHNVLELTTELTFGETYYWRVDTTFGTGDVWEFTVADEYFVYDPTACLLEAEYVAEMDKLRVALNKDKAWGAKQYKYCQDATVAPEVTALWEDPNELLLLKEYEVLTCDTWQCGREQMYAGSTCDLSYIASSVMGRSASLGKIAGNLSQGFCRGEDESCAVETHDSVSGIPSTAELTELQWDECNFDLLFLETEQLGDLMNKNSLFGPGEKWCNPDLNDALVSFMPTTKMLGSGLCSDETIVLATTIIKGDWFGLNHVLPMMECL